MRSVQAARFSDSPRRGGFSLVEVMVAFTILGIGLLTIAGAQVKAVHGTQNGRHLSQAGLLAQSQIEQLARSNWVSLAPTAWTVPTTVSTAVADGGGGSIEQVYSVSWRIQNLVLNETRSIDVQVTWTESNGRNRSVGTSTIRFNRENL